MNQPVPALLPRGEGHQFLLYGDSCSGVPGALHEHNFAMLNAIVRRLTPAPEFILFPGDEIIGLTSDETVLRAQWKHWLEVETAWLDRRAIPIWHTTGNHTTYDAMSEAVFRDVLRLPANGPRDQAGLSYFVRRGDLLLVFVNTLASGLGGEGHVETAWLEETLQRHDDARYKLVLGHHPVFPVNGFSGTYQREIGHEYAAPFWSVLRNGGVLAYLCSHILAFDVQVHDGILQICTAGAGTAHRMPEGVEYLHLVQVALDEIGIRFQVIDTSGAVREAVEWPPAVPSAWTELSSGEIAESFDALPAKDRFVELRLQGRAAVSDVAPAQTILSGRSPDSPASIWLGLRGPKQTLTVTLAREAGRSPSYWFGPDIAAGADFDIHVGLNADMGPGGIMFRHHDSLRWSSLRSATARGLEGLGWPANWKLIHDRGGDSFRGTSLKVSLAR